MMNTAAIRISVLVVTVLDLRHGFPAFSIPFRLISAHRCCCSGSIHFQFRISGKSWPCLSMYCLCSMSLSCICCFR